MFFLMDICLIETEKNIRIFPKSITGMLWLQTHFEEIYWDDLFQCKVALPSEDIKKLSEDARAAGLKLNFLQNLCISEKF